MKLLGIAILLFLSTHILFAQQIKILTEGTKTNLRGVTVVNDSVYWVSGSIGKVGRTIDAGINWEWITIPKFEKTDFRDIHAYDANTALIMAIDSPAYILKTVDAGKTWKVVFEKHIKGIFLDAFDFKDEYGIALGDPIDGRFYLVETKNYGDSWNEVKPKKRPKSALGETSFASSGTNIKIINKNNFVFISGGLESNFYYKHKLKFKLPMQSSKESTGANSFDINKKGEILFVGGDFINKENRDSSIFLTDFKNKDQVKTLKSTIGYKSCVSFLNNSEFVTCGLTGVEFYNLTNKQIVKISNISFNTSHQDDRNNTVILVGSNGKVGKFEK
jgi:hypothetical protein